MKFTSILGIALTLLTSSVVKSSPDCGEGVGTCPEGKCCSKYGYCGITSDHCENTLGCQTKYGSCYASTSSGKCGANYGRCPKPYQCCSKNGYCGEGNDYCGTGCQSAYGLCGNEEMVVEEMVEWVTEWVTETAFVYVEEIEDSRECGIDIGKSCPDNKCCSIFGYCGTSESYCSLSKGCQAKYGDCYEIVDTANIADEEKEGEGEGEEDTESPECGEGIGSCINAECCSKYGFCGTTKEYCDIDLGCQEEFGLCYSQSKEGQCGEDFGKCPKSDHCCSRDGYCGTGDEYCSMVLGCQSDYGFCINDIVEIVNDDEDEENDENDFYEEDSITTAPVIEPECGEGIGKCPDGQCCSKNGLCGTTVAFCNVGNGCQKEFGLCNSEDQTGKCGEGIGRCPVDEQCCSKEGYCGTTEHYCLPDNGCQELYGRCDSNVSNEFIE